MKRPTITEIAKALDISTATVSRALNDENSRISDATRQKVRKMADKLGYQPNIVASSLRKGNSSLIGIVVPFADRNFFASIIRGVEEEVKKHGFQVIICQSYDKLENEKEDIRALMAAQVRGIMISVSSESIKDITHLQNITKMGKSLIMFDRTLKSVKASSVCIDDYQGAFDMVNHMIQNGKQKIAIFCGNLDLDVFRERLRGYSDALRHNGLALEKNYQIELPSEVDAGEVGIEKLMSLDNPPDALFSMSDFSALGAMRWLRNEGYNIPGDFSVSGFGNDPFTEYLTPTLSSVNQKTIQIGNAAANLFLEEIKNEVLNPKKILLSPEIVIRESTQQTVTAV